MTSKASTTNKVSTTIRLSDTVDQWSRRVHVNVRNQKVTTVYRWKSKDGRDHTQRITMNDEQVGRLIAILSIAAGASVGESKGRFKVLNAAIDKEASRFLE